MTRNDNDAKRACILMRAQEVASELEGYRCVEVEGAGKAAAGCRI